MKNKEEANEARLKAKQNLDEAYEQLVLALLKGEFNAGYTAVLHEVSLKIYELNKRL